LTASPPSFDAFRSSSLFPDIMDLWQLTIFCKIVEQRSFSKAGKLVHLSQPTVSSHIKDLEHHFGCRLIDRLAKEAVPTREGELLYH